MFIKKSADSLFRSELNSLEDAVVSSYGGLDLNSGQGIQEASYLHEPARLDTEYKFQPGKRPTSITKTSRPRPVEHRILTGPEPPLDSRRSRFTRYPPPADIRQHCGVCTTALESGVNGA
ncbi:hypothetical protein PITC_084750 [Penicillium italicum]|uniref:Uncharacterized protein n=1 Tax=Penicillium italicum TaxID=40296 RepID=A0A0A2L4W7_PENIT|nr:hypothetical protein PITC_084750 [Penicillium italicum]